MKNLSCIQEYIGQNVDLLVGDLQADSRRISVGDVFVAMNGQVQDGRAYITKAIAQGAAAVIYENGDGFSFSSDGIKCFGISDLNSKIPQIAAKFYGEPSKVLKVIGVTGTNGKSSITYYIAQLLAALGYKCAIIGTVGNGFIDNLEATSNTTPGPIELQQLLVKFLENGAQYVAMEVSSHGIAQGRINGVHYERTAFTNLSRDHLDFHKTIEAYYKVKEDFILENKDRVSVVNFDDSMIRGNLLPKLDSKVAETVGMGDGADFLIKEPTAAECGTTFKLSCKNEKEYDVFVPLIGLFNVYNAVMALALVNSLADSYEKLISAMRSLKPLIGRMELFKTKKSPLCIVDYAHTPDGLQKAIAAAREHTRGKLYVVCGCGGDRDNGKRPAMGKIATSLADRVIFTNDNPRTEDPVRIMNQIIEGADCNNYQIEYDRKQAIIKAVTSSSNSDLVLIAGKGHEDYQIIGNVKHHFSDQEIVREVIETL